MCEWNVYSVIGRVAGGVLGLALLNMAAAQGSAAFVDSHASPGVGSNGAAYRSSSPGWLVRIDNDLFAGRATDRDYTGGLEVTAVDENDRVITAVNRSIHRWLDERVGRRRPEDAGRALDWTLTQAGVQAFTPHDIGTEQVLLSDRPYATLLYLGTARYSLDLAGRKLNESTLTLGALGLDAVGALQGGLHRLLDSAEPRGYGHQISNGGEATIRYELARHSLLSEADSPSGVRRDLRFSVAGSVGYVTELSAGFEWRVGRIVTPWWAAAAELGPEHSRHYASSDTRSTRSELYFVSGSSVRVRAYTALLQGQFRDSDVELSSAMLRHVVGQAWFGAMVQFRNVRVGYTVRYQSPEIRRGVGARSSSWAEIAVIRG